MGLVVQSQASALMDDFCLLEAPALRARSAFRLKPQRRSANTKSLGGTTFPTTQFQILDEEHAHRPTRHRCLSTSASHSFQVGRLVTFGEHNERYPTTCQSLVLYKFCPSTLFSGQDSPVWYGKVAKGDAPAGILGGVHFACVYAEVRHEQSAFGLERDGTRRAARFHLSSIRTLKSSPLAGSV